jgi:hypothetical protein
MWRRGHEPLRGVKGDVNDFVVSFALVSKRLIRAFLAEEARRTEARFSGGALERVVLVSGGRGFAKDFAAEASRERIDT